MFLEVKLPYDSLEDHGAGDSDVNGTQCKLGTDKLNFVRVKKT